MRRNVFRYSRKIFNSNHEWNLSQRRIKTLQRLNNLYEVLEAFGLNTRKGLADIETRSELMRTPPKIVTSVGLRKKKYKMIKLFIVTYGSIFPNPPESDDKHLSYVQSPPAISIRNLRVYVVIKSVFT